MPGMGLNRDKNTYYFPEYQVCGVFVFACMSGRVAVASCNAKLLPLGARDRHFLDIRKYAWVWFLQRVKTGDWKFQNYDMNTSYLVSCCYDGSERFICVPISLVELEAREFRFKSTIPDALVLSAPEHTGHLLYCIPPKLAFVVSACPVCILS